jgi:hypothetical protein
MYSSRAGELHELACNATNNRSHLVFQLLTYHVNGVGGNQQMGLIEILDDEMLLFVHGQNELLDGRIP